MDYMMKKNFMMFLGKPGSVPFLISKNEGKEVGPVPNVVKEIGIVGEPGVFNFPESFPALGGRILENLWGALGAGHRRGGMVPPLARPHLEADGSDTFADIYFPILGLTAFVLLLDSLFP